MKRIGTFLLIKLIDRPTDRPTDLPTYQSTYWSTDRPTDSQIGRPTNWPTDWQTRLSSQSGWLADCQGDWLFDRLFDRSINWLTDWSINVIYLAYLSILLTSYFVHVLSLSKYPHQRCVLLKDLLKTWRIVPKRRSQFVATMWLRRRTQ